MEVHVPVMRQSAVKFCDQKLPINKSKIKQLKIKLHLQLGWAEFLKASCRWWWIRSAVLLSPSPNASEHFYTEPVHLPVESEKDTGVMSLPLGTKLIVTTTTVEMSCTGRTNLLQYLAEDVELITRGMFTGGESQNEQDSLPWTEATFVWVDLNQLAWKRNFMKTPSKWHCSDLRTTMLLCADCIWKQLFSIFSYVFFCILWLAFCVVIMSQCDPWPADGSCPKWSEESVSGTSWSRRGVGMISSKQGCHQKRRCPLTERPAAHGHTRPTNLNTIKKRTIHGTQTA